MVENRNNDKVGVGGVTYLPVEKNYYLSGNAQPETIAIIKWTEDHNFVLSATLHSGAWPWHRR